MSKFLSDEWHAEVTNAVNASDSFKSAAKGVNFVLQYQVLDGDAKYYWKIADGTFEEAAGTVDSPDVTIQYDSETAAAIVRGDLNPQAAFMQGKLKLAPGSNMGKLMQNLGLIQGMGPVLKNVNTEF